VCFSTKEVQLGITLLAKDNYSNDKVFTYELINFLVIVNFIEYDMKAFIIGLLA